MVLHIYPQFHPQNFCLIVLLMWMLFSLLLTTSLCLFSHDLLAPVAKRSYPPPSKNIPPELFFAKPLASHIEKRTTFFSTTWRHGGAPPGTVRVLVGEPRRLPFFLMIKSDRFYASSVQKIWSPRLLPILAELIALSTRLFQCSQDKFHPCHSFSLFPLPTQSSLEHKTD